MLNELKSSSLHPSALQDADDLPFRKGEILYVVNKDEDQWWTARNSQGHIGQIPVPYVQRVSITHIKAISFIPQFKPNFLIFEWVFFSLQMNSTMKAAAHWIDL